MREHVMADVAAGLARRLRLPGGEQHHRSTAAVGLFALMNGTISIGLMATAAAVTQEPFVFPSLGPTAFLLFYTPMAASASPRHTVIGHLIGVIAGYVALIVFGLQHAEPTIIGGVDVPRIGAAALSLGVTCGVMIWMGVPHPPAGATTMIVSLGIISSAAGLATIMLGVILLVLQAVVINRLAGIPYPLWSPVAARNGAG